MVARRAVKLTVLIYEQRQSNEALLPTTQVTAN